MRGTRVFPVLVLVALATACDSPDMIAPDAQAPLSSIEATAAATVADDITILDFEELFNPGDTGYGVEDPYASQGYLISRTPTEDDNLIFATAGETSQWWAGSTGMYVNRIDGIEAILTREDGGTFSVESIDIATLMGAPGEVTFVGTTADGETVIQTVSFDHTYQFETHALDGFENLVEFRWLQNYPGPHQFDNIVVISDEAVGDEVPTTREACMDGGWAAFDFQNQGQCIRFVNTGQAL